MVNMESFAHAFGFDSKSDDVWTTLGKVTAVNDGTLSVLLGGSATPTECEAYCLASVGDIVFVAITKGRARAVACKGVDAATWRTALGLGSMATEDSSDYLPVSGGTLTGEPTVLQNNASIKSSTADSTLSDNGVSANSYLYYRFLDKNDLFTGWFGNIIKTDGMVQTQLAARKKVNGSNIDNVLYLDVDASGNRIVAMTDPAAWLTALGIGTKYENTKTGLSVTANQDAYVQGAKITLPAGKYIIYTQWYFGSTSSTPSSTTVCVGNQSTVYNDSRFRIRQYDSWWTAHATTYICQLNSQTDIYSYGSCSLARSSCESFIRAIKVG